MNRKCFALMWVFILCFCGQVFGEELMLPFQGGATYKCTQGTYEDPDNLKQRADGTWYESNPTHNEYALGGKMKYAVDFGLPCRTPVVASRSGIVTFTGLNGGWGNMVIINYNIANNEFGRYAHLDEILVTVDDNVQQGELIGYSGNTGYSTPESGEGYHLHYQFEDQNGQSKPISFIDVEESDGVPKRFVPVWENPNGLRNNYTSLNTYNPNNEYRVGKFTDGWKIESSNQGHFVPYSRPFAVAYYHNGGIELIGYPTESVHTGGKPLNSEDIYQQELITENGHIYKLILNPYVWNIRFEYLGVVFPIHGQILNYWEQHYFDLGAPVTNEYYYTGGYSSDPPRYVVQWFERSDNEYYVVIYDTWDGNIWHESEHTTGVPKDNHFNQSVEQNCGCPNGICGVGGGDGDDPDPTPYPIPQNLTATPINSSQISVSWSNNPDVLQYKIYFQGNGQDYDTTVENNPRLFYGLGPNTICFFRIQANYGDGNWSEISDPVQATTLPFDGSDIVVHSMTTCKGLIDFKEAVNPTNYFDNQDDDIYFIIKLEENYPYGALYLRFDLYNPSNELNKSFDRMGNYDFDGPNFTTCAQLNAEGNNLYDHKGIWSVKLYYGPTIYDIDNYLATYSFQIAEYISEPPATPTGLTAEVISDSEINLSWDSVEGVDGYKLYRDDELIATIPDTVYSDSGLDSNTQYCYKIKAYAE
ncbi:peptidoglycan DD-metalloendopeptidase family protein, partial [bacterium]|nr:peptidoglycan DD-metalloendopeptidase family protein [bacterium]